MVQSVWRDRLSKTLELKLELLRSWHGWWRSERIVEPFLQVSVGKEVEPEH